MGKIKKTASPKHAATLSPFIANFIKDAIQLPLPRLQEHLEQFPWKWPFPRGDLYHWIPLLNRFDDILEQFNTTYELDKGPQSVPFGTAFLAKSNSGDAPTSLSKDADEALIHNVITFSRLLIENCGNRSLYASSANLSNLLNSTSLSLVLSTLYLGLRLAQRYCASRQRMAGPHLNSVNPSLLAAHYMFDLDKIEKLALPFVTTLTSSEDSQSSTVKETEKGLSITPSLTPDLIALVRDESLDRWAEYGGAWVTYYSSGKKQDEQDDEDDTLEPATPTRPPRSSGRPDLASRTSDISVVSTVSIGQPTQEGTGLQLFNLEPSEVARLTLSDLAKSLDKVPQPSRYELFSRIRAARALSIGPESRRQIVAIRLLALANLANIYPENSLQRKILQSEADEPRRSQLPYQLCDLAHPPGKQTASIPKWMQSMAILVLESLLNHKNKSTEVVAALNVNVNHGVLAFVLRKAVLDLASDISDESSETPEDAEWRENLFALLHSLPKLNARAGEGFVAAGLLDVFVDALNTETRKADQNHPRILNFLDVFVYNTKDAFTSFINAKGLDAISNLMCRQVDRAEALVDQGKGYPESYRTQVTDYKIPFVQQQTLRALLKFMQHIITITGGPFDRLLRNLLESSDLLKSFCKIIEHPQVFGSNVWSATVEIFSTFIHQEPTSYSAIAEAGLIKSFLSTVTRKNKRGAATSSATGVESNGPSNPVTESTTSIDSTGAESQGRKAAVNWKQFEAEFSESILPTAETITTIPLAFGAICLNENGMQMFQEYRALQVFFRVFLCPAHVRALANTTGDELENLGATFDELARHHPGLKPVIVENTWKMVAVISIMSIQRAVKRNVGAKLFITDSTGNYIPDPWLDPDNSSLHSLYGLIAAPGSQEQSQMPTTDNDNDVQMDGAGPSEEQQIREAIQATPEVPSVAQPVAQEPEQPTNASHSSFAAVLGPEYDHSHMRQLIPSDSDYVLVYAKFLQGFFSNPSLCGPFAETPGIDRLVEMATSPALPFDFGNSNACTQVTRVFCMLAEQKPHLVLTLLLRRGIAALRCLKPFVEHSGDTSFFSSYFQIDSPGQHATRRDESSQKSGSFAMKMLVAIQSICTILQKVLIPQHRQHQSAFTQVNFADIYAEFIDLLAELQSRCIWESVWLQEHLPPEWKKPKESSSDSVSARVNSAPEANTTNAGVEEDTSTNQPDESASSKPVDSSRHMKIEQQNWIVVRHVLGQLPSNIASLFSTVSRMVFTKKVNPDSYQKQSAVLVANHLANALASQLSFHLPETATATMNDHYRTLALNLAAQSLIEKRPDAMERGGGSPQALTLTLLSFLHTAHGFEILTSLSKQFFDSSVKLLAEQTEETKSERKFCLEGLQNIVRILSQLTNNHIISDAQQTHTLQARADRDKARPEYFAAGQLLVELRLKAMHIVLPIWNAEITDQAFAPVIRGVCNVIKNVLEGTGEQGGAINRSDKVSARPRSVHRRWRPRHPDQVQRLVSETVDEDFAMEAVYRCADNVSNAQEYIAMCQRAIPRTARNPIPEDDAPLQDSEDNGAQPEQPSTARNSESASRPRLHADGADILRRIVEASGDTDSASFLDEFNEAMADDSDEPSQPATRTVSRGPEETQPASEAKVTTVEDLDECRTEIQEGMMDRCLSILSTFNDLTFELADLITASASRSENEDGRAEAGETLVQSLVSLAGSSSDADKLKQVAAHAHLLGIVLQDSEFFEAAKESLRENFSDLVELIEVPSAHTAGDDLSWLGNVLLVIERILAEDAQPRQIIWQIPSPEQPEEDPYASLPPPMATQDERQVLLSKVLELLPRVGKNAALALAVMRVLVSLTRNRRLASQMGQKQNIRRLFLTIRQLSATADEKLRSAFMIVLRHIVEDMDTMRRIMARGIMAYFNEHGRQADTAVYTRNLYHLVLRDPELFVDVTNEKVILPHFDRSRSAQTISPRPDPEPAAQEQGPTDKVENDVEEVKPDDPQPSAENPPSGEKTKPSELRPPIVENPDGVIHFLLSELLAYKDVEDTAVKTSEPTAASQNAQPDVEMTTGESSPNVQPTSDSNQQQSGQQSSEKQEFKAEEHPIYVYRCFLLQCLSELLQSYNRTKVEFINFSRKADPLAATPSKPRSGVLNYMLNVLIPTGTVQHPEEMATRKKTNISFWAIYVIVSLCARSTENHALGFREPVGFEDDPELIFVRRFVLEHALKAFKDAHASSEPYDMKYSRLLSLSDIFNRMLAGSSYSHPRSGQDDSLVVEHRNIARIMYEKNFIAALTSSISDIDLNFPGANRTVKYILRPLKLLTHTAIEVCMTSDSSSLGQTDDDEISSATSVSDEGEGREETPDLFRNSTLGMFEPGRDDEDDESSDLTDPDEAEEDVYGDVYADDMDYEEDGELDHHNDDVVSDEDEDMEGMGPIEGLSGDMGMDIEIEVDDNDNDDSSDAEDDSDEDEDDDDMSDDEPVSVIDELNGDDENASLGDDHNDHEWEDEDEDELQFEHHVIEQGLDPNHNGLIVESDTGSDNEDLMPSGDPLDIQEAEAAASLLDMQHDHDPEEAGSEEEEDGEDEDEELDEEFDVPFDGDEDESEMNPFAFGWPGSGGHSRHVHRRHWHNLPQDPDRLAMPGYRSHRPGGRNADDGTNPLLNRSIQGSAPNTTSRTPPRRFNEPQIHYSQPNVVLGEQNPIAYLNSLISALGRGGPLALPPGMHQLPGGGLQFTMRAAPGHGGHHMDAILEIGEPGTAARTQPSRPPQSDPFSAVSFEPVVTEARWQEEARMLFGASFSEKSQRVVNSILRLLVPPAIEADRIRKEKAEEEQRKAAEEARRLEAEREKEREEREAKEAAQRAEAEAEAEAAAAAAAAAERARAEEAAQADKASESEDADAMDIVEEEEQPAGSSNEAAASSDEARVFADIRGRQIDITELGIDLEVLNALPEEMREEVIMQQYAEHRSNQREAGQEPIAINPEFLEALPQEIRDELLAQEAQDRRTREREAARRRSQANNGGQAQPEEMDTASFVASLDPMLRQQVLLDLDEDTIARLPDEFAAEARALGGHHRRRALDPSRLFGGLSGLEQQLRTHPGRARAVEDSTSKPRRPIIQMIDKSGVATLLRLMFAPISGSARPTLNGILVNACGNRQTRGEVVAGLLSILQDGSADVAAVERSLNSLTLRAKQPGHAGKTPQSSKKQSSIGFTPNNEVTPLTVVSQCLQTLTFLTHQINHLPQFFLTEHEALKLKGGRKGKAKDTKSSKYPLTALLNLLDRQLVIDSPGVMEQLALLLASVTAPLGNLLNKKERPDEDKQPDPQQEQQQSEANNAQSTPAQETTQAEASESKDDAPTTAKETSKKAKVLSPPDLDSDSLRLLINIMTARDCSSKTFRDTLSTMTNLSAIPGARETFGDELIKQARELGKAIYASLDQLIKALSNAEDELEAQSLALANFSPSGSNQAKLNRILTALDYLFEPKSEENKKMPAEEVKAVDAKGRDLLANIYGDSIFMGLWNKLSDCLSATKQSSENYFFNVATILLPLIESLMVVSKRIPMKDASKLSSPVTPQPESEMRAVFFSFTNSHKKVLNDLVRHNPKLMSGSFSVLVKNSNVLEFDNKRNYFNRRLHHRTSEQRQQAYPSLQLHVRRDFVFLDSYAGLHFKSPEEIKYGKFNIRFQAEEGVDAGGVTREWFQAMARQMFNPDYALFNPVAADRTTFHPNGLSWINPEHLSFFKFIGRIIGKALYENRVLDCHFSRAVYKRILGRPLNMKDMETIDLDYTRSAEWILENDITDVITETFSLVEEKFGVEEIIDLIPDGRNMPVTDENKEEYIRLVIDYKLTGAVKEQLENFLQGFHEIVPAELISIFDENELELLISGMPDIDVDDWKNNTEYHNYSASSPQVQWFWRAVRSFDKEERAKLLQFVTGTGKVPLNGFKELEGMNGFTRFNIHKDFGNKDRLPSSHTCFNQLDLPEYESYEALKKALNTAMTTGGEYFGFA